MKTKTIEIPEAKVKITIEWQEDAKQIDLPVSRSLSEIESEVYHRVIGPTSLAYKSLVGKTRQQYIVHARHIFCYTSVRRYGYSINEVAAYLDRDRETVIHSIKRVESANQKTSAPLWNAWRRYEQ